MQKFSEVPRTLDAIILSATPAWVVVPIFFGGLLYLLPSSENAYVLVVLQIAL
jgi:hypothetical protein